MQAKIITMVIKSHASGHKLIARRGYGGFSFSPTTEYLISQPSALQGECLLL